MRSHFAEIGTRMTITGQRLDPPWRAYTTGQKPTPGGMRGSDFRKRLRATACASVLVAAALGLPSLALAAGAPQAPPPAAAPATPVAAPVAPAPHEDPPPPPQPIAASAPSGMVRYEKPVFRNGHYVLWHGAWRGGRAAAAARLAPARPHEFLIAADGADAAATRMAVELAAAMQSGGLHARAVPGKTSVAALDKAVDGDTADLVIAPLDGLIASGRAQGDKDSADWRNKTPYLLRLANEPVELITPRAITDIRQLAGRKVNVGAPDSAAAATAALVFSRLNVAPKLTNEDAPAALDDLTGGQIDAMFVVGGGDSKALAALNKGGLFHVVAVPYPPALQALYRPMRLTSRELPELIGDDEKVDTIGVTTALLAIDAAPRSPRAERIAPLAELLFSSFEPLRDASDNSDWKEVNLTARLLGWPRLGAAQSWLEQNQGPPNAALDAFRDAAQTAAGDGEGPSAADSDRLYESLMRWNGTAQ
jgi:TRAP-type uncharacterized transport system substrate-binding protein